MPYGVELFGEYTRQKCHTDLEGDTVWNFWQVITEIVQYSPLYGISGM